MKRQIYITNGFKRSTTDLKLYTKFKGDDDIVSAVSYVDDLLITDNNMIEELQGELEKVFEMTE